MGAGLYLVSLLGSGRLRRSETYIGGERMDEVYLRGVERGAARDVEVTGGDFYDTVRGRPSLRGFFRAEDPLSDVVKATVFRMTPGETSKPIRDAGRFYIFRLTEKKARPLEEVEKSIDTAISRGALNARLAEIRGDIKIFPPNDPEWLDSRSGN